MDSAGETAAPAANVMNAFDAEDPAQALPYHVELWNADRQSVQRVLGDAVSAPLAQAIFQSAIQEYPDRYITLRYGTCIIAVSGKRDPPAT